MKDHDLKTAAAAGVEALLVAILALPAVAHLVTTTRLYKARNGYGTLSGFYEDGDGEATEKSTHEYSDLPSRVAAWLSSSLGLAAAIVAAVLAHDSGPSSETTSAAIRLTIVWADVVAWVSRTHRIPPLLPAWSTDIDTRGSSFFNARFCLAGVTTPPSITWPTMLLSARSLLWHPSSTAADSTTSSTPL